MIKKNVNKQQKKKVISVTYPKYVYIKISKKNPLTRILSYYTAMQTLLPHLLFLKKKWF